jgi:hypothetical protein
MRLCDRDTRRAEALSLAEDMNRLADRYRRIDRVLTRDHDLEVLDVEFWQLQHLLDRAWTLGINRERFRHFVDRECRMFRNSVVATDLASALDRTAVTLRGQYGGRGWGPSWQTRAEWGLLGCMACFLPDAKRSRFLVEAFGNLGDCEHWWQRVDQLVGLAIGTPRLAWMMRRETRRGRV